MDDRSLIYPHKEAAAVLRKYPTSDLVKSFVNATGAVYDALAESRSELFRLRAQVQRLQAENDFMTRTLDRWANPRDPELQDAAAISGLPGVCTCPTECDCEDVRNGRCSNECPVHNRYPAPSPGCPVHWEEFRHPEKANG
jgi:hypothetical protein